MARHGSDFTFRRFVVIVRAVLLRLSVLLFAGFLLIIAILSVTRPDSVAVVRTYFMDIITPMMTLVGKPQQWGASISSTWDEAIFIYQENDRLRKENTKVPQLETELKDLYLENQRLKSLLGYVSDLKYEYVTARVVGNLGQPYNREAMVNAGELSGLQPGLVAVNDQGLVGRLLEVGFYSSRLLLITDKDSRIPVITENSREHAILMGDNSDVLRMLYLPENTEVQVGERVLSSGDGGVFPSDIPVGVIESIEGRTVEVRPYVDWWRLEYVQLVRPKKNLTDPAAGNVARPLESLEMKQPEPAAATPAKPKPEVKPEPKPKAKPKPKPVAEEAAPTPDAAPKEDE